MNSLLSKIVISQKENVLLQMRQSKLPLIFWGAGKIAEPIINYLEGNGITVDGVFVDDAYYISGKKFHNILIQRLEDVEKSFFEFNVVLGHSAYERGPELLEKNDRVKNVYYITSVAYGQTESIQYEFVKKNIASYQKTYEILEDTQSRLCMEAYLNARINDDISYVLGIFEKKSNYFNNEIFSISARETYMDIGAYTGDTIELFLHECNKQYCHIYAFEVNDENYRVMEQYVKESGLEHIDLFHVGLSDKVEQIHFIENDDLSGMFSDKFSEGDVVTVQTTTIDTLYQQKKISDKITFLKINFFAGTLEVLRGSRQLICDFHPKIAITVGFDEWSLVTIPQYLKSIVPEYKIFLRYSECMPARLVMYAYC